MIPGVAKVSDKLTADLVAEDVGCARVMHAADAGARMVLDANLAEAIASESTSVAEVVGRFHRALRSALGGGENQDN